MRAVAGDDDLGIRLQITLAKPWRGQGLAGEAVVYELTREMWLARAADLVHSVIPVVTLRDL